MLEHHGYERSGRCTVSPRQDGAALVLHVAGDLDVLTAPTLMTHLDVALSGGAALLIVDLEIPSVPTLFQPLLSTIPMQLFAAGVARARGYDVDKPRNLAKSVTVE